MIIDAFTYNGEADLLEIRLNILFPFVDKFVIVEAPTTFSGNVKPLYFEEQRSRFSQWSSKINYVVNPDEYDAWEIEHAELSPNTIGAKHWKHEFLQKEFVKQALRKYQNNAICFVGDVDEVWDPEEFIYTNTIPIKIKLRVYAYWLNYRSNEQFWGTLRATNELIQANCLNHLRTNTRFNTLMELGWHFTSMGGLTEVRRKLNDSYTPESYNTHDVQYYLGERMAKGEDYLGRNFEFKIDGSEWPQYLKDNREKYAHLLKSNQLD